jgi:hypothetical protein
MPSSGMCIGWYFLPTLFLARGFFSFHIEDGDDTFLRNASSDKSHKASSPTRRYSCVLMMVYNTQNQWDFRFCPSSWILSNWKNLLLETEPIYVLRRREREAYSIVSIWRSQQTVERLKSTFLSDLTELVAGSTHLMRETFIFQTISFLKNGVFWDSYS